jgi:hypothetical protein
VADQSTLSPAQLAVLPAGNAGTPITSPMLNVTMQGDRADQQQARRWGDLDGVLAWEMARRRKSEAIN